MGSGMRRGLVAWSLALACAGAGNAQPPSAARQDEPISLDVRDADVRDLLNALASNHNLNVVYGPHTEASISIHLEKVSLPTALDAIVRAAGLRSYHRDNVLYVLQASDKEEAQYDTRVFQLQYADPEKTLDLLKSCVGSHGKISSSVGTRTIVVWDEPYRLDLVSEVIRAADRKPRQVLIESKILEVDLTDNLRSGVNWTEVLSQGKFGGTGTQSGFANPPNFLNSGFFATLKRGDLRILIETLQQHTTVNTLANPKVLTLEDHKAEVVIGGRIGYPVTTSTTTATLQSIQFLEVGTQLKLTPHVTDDGSIYMDVHPEVSDGKVTDGLPSETTTETTTTVLVKPDETLFIGGLIREKVSKDRRGIPILCRIPVLGWFFGKTVNSVEKGEIVVLITPHLVTDAASSLQNGNGGPENH